MLIDAPFSLLYTRLVLRIIKAIILAVAVGVVVDFVWGLGFGENSVWPHILSAVSSIGVVILALRLSSSNSEED